MRVKKDQHTVGTPVRPRGQQMGFAGQRDQNRQEKEETPAVRGDRKSANKMFADKSSQHVGSDSTKPSTNSPSVPAMNVTAKHTSGGEGQFKQRLARKRSQNHSR